MIRDWPQVAIFAGIVGLVAVFVASIVAPTEEITGDEFDFSQWHGKTIQEVHKENGREVTIRFTDGTASKVRSYKYSLRLTNYARQPIRPNR